MAVVDLPTEQVRLLRAFARTEILTWCRRFGDAPKWRQIVVGLPAAVGVCARMIRRGEQLGLPRRAFMRAIHAEIDSIEAG